MKSFIALALVASASLCLSGCLTASQTSALVQDAAPAIQVVVTQDAQAGIIDQATADAISGYAQVAQVAAASYQTGAAACVGQDAKACALSSLSVAVGTGEQLLAQPSVSKLIGAAAGPRVQLALTAAKRAVMAAQDAKAAGAATTEQARMADAMAAVFQLNGAILAAIQAAR